MKDLSVLRVNIALAVCVLAFTACFCQVAAQPKPSRLKDLDNAPNTDSASPSDFTSMNGILYFAASDVTHGTELWRSDGTEAGTWLVKDILPDGSSGPVSLTVAGNVFFFVANDRIHGAELWKSDGTEAGTVLVKDIVPGAESSGANQLVNVNGTIYFTTFFQDMSVQLWKSDGTPEGTEIVIDPNPGPGDDVGLITAVNATLFFLSYNDVNGMELWKTNASGTILVKDINPGAASSNCERFTVAGNKLYFMADDGIHGSELWATDGTDAGTGLVKDMAAGPDNAGIIGLTALNNVLYFLKYGQSSSDAQLWKTDGTDAGTLLVKDGIPRGNPSYLPLMKVTGNHVYFSGDALWKSDGTTTGTGVVKQFPAPCIPLGEFNNNLYFQVPFNASQLWKTDGTESGTVLLGNINIAGKDLISLPPFVGAGSKLFFSAINEVAGLELWATDGTAAGTVLVKDINTEELFTPDHLKATGNSLSFTNIPGANRYELWQSNGTMAGTTLVGSGAGSAPLTDSVAISGNKKLMIFDDGMHGMEPWGSDGTAPQKLLKDIAPGATGSSPVLLRGTVNGNVFFTAVDGDGHRKLWMTDGTEAGTLPLTDASVYHEMLIGDVLYFISGRELWRSDATTNGTLKVKAFASGPGRAPYNLFNFYGTLFFFTEDGAHGCELWKSDGTEAGTVMVKDIHAGYTDQYYPTFIGAINGKFIFSSSSSGEDYRVWVSDGTEAGTALLKDINPKWSGLTPAMGADDHFLYFAATDADHGRELWKTDGTTAGTTLVKDIMPGAYGAVIPTDFAMMKEKLFFIANDGVHGHELWSTDGTEAGTVMVGDVMPGALSSGPKDFCVMKNVLFFIADDGIQGQGIWKYDPEPQDIIFDAIPDKTTIDVPFTLSATASSGLPVSFALVSGPAALSGSTLSITGAGTVVVRAAEVGVGDHIPAEPVDRSFAVAKATQTIFVAPIPTKNTHDAPFNLTATSSSGLPVSFNVVSGPASISQSTVTLLGAGEVTVKASQSGNDIYDAAPDVLQTFTVELVMGLEHTKANLVTVYPNPSSGALYLALQAPGEVSSIVLLNASGLEIRQWHPSPGESDRLITSDLAPGMYLLKVVQENKTFTQKIVVQK